MIDRLVKSLAIRCGKLRIEIACACVLSFAQIGCVAVWGAAHNVEHADANGIRIRYDAEATSSLRAQIVARDHCRKYGKIAEPISSEMPGLLIGIIEESYQCVTPPSK